MESIKVKDFNLKLSLDNGQFHQWIPRDEGFILKDGSKVFYVEQNKSTIKFEGINKEELKEFLGVNHNYSDIIKDIDRDDFLSKSIEELHGMRLFNQDLWTCTIAFIVSQNNNIKRIMKNVEDLCETCGTKKKINGVATYSFPSPKQIRGKDLTHIKLGYREKYIKKVAEIVTPKFLKEVEAADYKTARELLMTLPGIGPKVADCICLFALNHFEAFPIDTWMNQCLDKYYSASEMNLKEKQAFSEEYFGPFRGYAQQFLFHSMRLE